MLGIIVGMQGIIKTKEKRVQLNYPGHINIPVIYEACMSMLKCAIKFRNQLLPKKSIQ